ncbi:MAG: hypothetical protein ABIS84_07305, partial [Arachnia sp.]
MNTSDDGGDDSAPETAVEPARSPVFVDDSGRRLLRVRAAAWFGSTTGILFLSCLCAAVLIGSLASPADWNHPFAPRPNVDEAQAVQPSNRSTLEALILVPPLFSPGPDRLTPPSTAASRPNTSRGTQATETTVAPSPTSPAIATTATQAAGGPTAPTAKPSR